MPGVFLIFRSNLNEFWGFYQCWSVWILSPVIKYLDGLEWISSHQCISSGWGSSSRFGDELKHIQVGPFYFPLPLPRVFSALLSAPKFSPPTYLPYPKPSPTLSSPYLNLPSLNLNSFSPLHSKRPLSTQDVECCGVLKSWSVELWFLRATFRGKNNPHVFFFHLVIFMVFICLDLLELLQLGPLFFLCPFFSPHCCSFEKQKMTMITKIVIIFTSCSGSFQTWRWWRIVVISFIFQWSLLWKIENDDDRTNHRHLCLLFLILALLQ
jgi:hypothetical protein